MVEVQIDRSIDDLYQQYYSPMSATVYNTDTLYFGNSSYLYPGLRFRVIDEQGRLRRHMRFFVNGVAVFDRATVLQPADELILVQALSGG